MTVVHRPHKFDRPPPGQGGAAERICVQCGARRSVVGEGSECPGKHPVAMAETVEDYDPFE